MTLDGWLPSHDAREVHRIRIRASAPAVFAALERTDFGGPLAKAMLALRVLPEALRHRRAGARRLLRRYWRVVRPGSGVLRHLMLRAVRRTAERAPALTPRAGSGR